MGVMGKKLLATKQFMRAMDDIGMTTMQKQKMREHPYFQLDLTEETPVVHFMDITADSAEFGELLEAIFEHFGALEGHNSLRVHSVHDALRADIRSKVFENLRRSWLKKKSPAAREMIQYDSWVHGMPMGDLAKKHGLHPGTIRRDLDGTAFMLKRAISKAYDDVKSELPEVEEDLWMLDLRALAHDEGIRLKNSLRRFQILTIEQLQTKTVDDLLNITPFSQRWVDVVTDALSQFDVTLADG